MFHLTSAHRIVLLCLVTISLLAARAQAQSVSPSDRDSDRKEALRHITLDLLGRLPTEDETKAFLSDKSPHAYQSLINRLEGSDRQERHVAEQLDKQISYFHDYSRLMALTRVDSMAQAPTAYLGVGVDPPDDVLRAQLGLPAGTGLVVNYVDPNGPSKDLIHIHDVLQKLDDQILINGEQFSTLVKMHKRGDEVTVVIIRQAKPTQITVKLGEREMASDSDLNLKVERADLADAENNLRAVNFMPTKLDLSGDVRFQVNPKENSLTAVRTGPITVDDEKTTAVFLQTASGNFITAFDKPSARLIFTGPVDTEQEYNSLPEEVRNTIRLWWSPPGDAAGTTSRISRFEVPNGKVISYPDQRDGFVVKQLDLKPASAAPSTQPAQVEK